MPNQLRRPPKDTPELYAQESLNEDAIVHAHYFLPGIGADWYVTEYDAEQDLIFGWAEVIPGFGEWGYTSLSELEDVEIKVPVIIEDQNPFHFFVNVELDLNWTKRTMRDVLANR